MNKKIETQEIDRLERLIRTEEDSISIYRQKQVELETNIETCETNINEYRNKIKDLKYEW